MAGDAAPGLTRDYFGLLGWRGHDASLWDRLVSEARERRAAGLERLPPMAGFDVDGGALARSRESLAAAGLGERIIVETGEVGDLAPPWPDTAGLVVCNPPWGERMSGPEAAAALYGRLGESLRKRFAGWRVELLSPAPTLASYLGLRPGRSHRLANGPIDCRATRFEVPAAGSRGTGSRPDGDGDPGADMFANRLRKNLRRLGAWARREGIDCYRLYDADMPEYAFAVDVYGAADTWAVAQEYEAPASIPRERAAARRETVLGAVATVLEIPPERVVAKTRRRQRGDDQYARIAREDVFHEVREDGCRLLVNLGDRLDTGLYLDHRPVRAMIRALAEGARFLNLFAYTGAATVHAAVGGARATTSVDLSRGYLDWARRNLALNGFKEEAHTLVRADCMEWLAGAASGELYDVVLLDAPTFSNSSAMTGTLDVQRDHVGLLRETARRLAPDGVLFFSNHLRRFRLDGDGLRRAGLVAEDITRETIPRDFERNPRAHHCWRIRHAD